MASGNTTFCDGFHFSAPICDGGSALYRACFSSVVVVCLGAVERRQANFIEAQFQAAVFTRAAHFSLFGDAEFNLATTMDALSTCLRDGANLFHHVR